MADGFGKASEACQALFPLLPLLGLGTAGNSAGSEAMRQAVSSARRDHGISLFDLAQNYGSEADIGWGLRAAGVERVDELGRRIFERTFILAKVDLATRAHEDPVKRMRRQERLFFFLAASCRRTLSSSSLGLPSPPQDSQRSFGTRRWAAR
jgi:aryl-alcohol dehydrogenase-like predicted oxidoreductase